MRHAHRGDNDAMSDDSTGLPSRQPPRKRSDDVHVSDFTMLVRVPGRPTAVRAYIEAERDDAVQYAAATKGEVVPLPLSPPVGYTPGPHGSLIPITSSEPTPDHLTVEVSAPRIET